ncbi:MAG TPA: 1-acyl-sn-glycerol-3-phosphate acyltransferase [Solirubrobacteraceae bacterium]|nr:1-acyl-sn-glycerol-3-phosphate acyltransferase [Solirubrobacteraceae bacterium]
MGPLISDDSTLSARWRRRARGIALELLAFVLITALSPVLLVAAAIADAALWLRRRKPWMAVRLVAMLWWFLLGELYGVAGLAVIWLTSRGDSRRRRRRVYRLKRRWLRSHLGGVRTLFRLRFEIDGLELAAPGPVLVMTRHASIIDNALPDVIIGGAHGTGFRFVIKRELRMLPTIDIGGRWVPTLFVRRGSGDTDAELAKMRALTEHLAVDDALLLYPEGTRWTAEKLARAQAIIAERQPELHELAARLRYVLPPRLGGALTLLQSARGVDVVLFGHFGLDGFEYVSDIWSGGLLGTTVRLKFWRYPAAEIPADRDELTAWLYARWLELDAWIADARTGSATGLGIKASAAAPVAAPLP